MIEMWLFYLMSHEYKKEHFDHSKYNNKEMIWFKLNLQ